MNSLYFLVLLKDLLIFLKLIKYDLFFCLS